MRMASADVKRDSVTLRIITRSPGTDLVLRPKTVGGNGVPECRRVDKMVRFHMRRTHHEKLGVGQIRLVLRVLNNWHWY